MSDIKKVLGMMSGTSVDGSVSAAIVETDGASIVKRVAVADYCYEGATGIRPIHHLTKAAELAFRTANGNHASAADGYHAALRAYVVGTFSLTEKQAQEKEAELFHAFLGYDGAVDLAQIIQRSTQVHLQAAQTILDQANVSASAISYVGYHGQTLYHDPFFNRTTVQVGNPQHLADTLQIPVVFDFRKNDVQNGGQGAPLAPVYHRALVQCAGMSTAAILNLGGTANLTVVSSTCEDMLGFDTGPANGLIDKYVKEKAGMALDRDSVLAEKGKVSEEVVATLVRQSIILKDGRNYLDIPPPKSLDIRDYTSHLPEFDALSVEDGCATLNAFTAECVGLAITWIERAGFEVPRDWVLCGGGAYSPHLKEQLRVRVGRRVSGGIRLVSADEVGWSAQGMEAELFAYLAARSARGLPITFPGTTGVREPMRGGDLYYPRS